MMPQRCVGVKNRMNDSRSVRPGHQARGVEWWLALPGRKTVCGRRPGSAQFTGYEQTLSSVSTGSACLDHSRLLTAMAPGSADSPTDTEAQEPGDGTNAARTGDGARACAPVGGAVPARQRRIDGTVGDLHGAARRPVYEPPRRAASPALVAPES
jgi:hypothetical protein